MVKTHEVWFEVVRAEYFKLLGLVFW
jgi:hypothetical protein